MILYPGKGTVMIARKFVKLQLKWQGLLHSKGYMKTYNRYLRLCGVDVHGSVKYIDPTVYVDTGYGDRIHIGDNCVISIRSILLAHDYAPECGMCSLGMGNPAQEKKRVEDVYIGDNVFIGAGCIVLPGTRIGDNCIIGAGTVCSGTIPENSVVVGDRWKVIRKTTDWAKEKMDMAQEKEGV